MWFSNSPYISQRLLPYNLLPDIGVLWVLGLCLWGHPSHSQHMLKKTSGACIHVLAVLGVSSGPQSHSHNGAITTHSFPYPPTWQLANQQTN